MLVTSAAAVPTDLVASLAETCVLEKQFAQKMRCVQLMLHVHAWFNMHMWLFIHCLEYYYDWTPLTSDPPD